MKVLILTDKPNWAYDSIAKAIVKYNTDNSLDITVMHVKKNKDQIKKVCHKFDRILLMGWQLYKSVGFLPLNKTIVGIHGHHAWDDRATMPDRDVPPPAELIDTLNKFLRVNAVSKRLFNLFKKHGVEKIYYTANGVDSDVFVPYDNIGAGFTVGYSGSKSHDWRKGISKFILPAAKMAGVGVHLAMLEKGKTLSLEEMPAFYSGLDAYICASSSEGFSLSVLEAASCGVPIISTKVGGCTELISDGEDGFLVDRDVDAIADKILILKNDPSLRNMFSKNMRNKIETEYDWSHRVGDWLDFIRS